MYGVMANHMIYPQTNHSLSLLWRHSTAQRRPGRGRQHHRTLRVRSARRKDVGMLLLIKKNTTTNIHGVTGPRKFVNLKKKFGGLFGPIFRDLCTPNSTFRGPKTCTHHLHLFLKKYVSTFFIAFFRVGANSFMVKASFNKHVGLLWGLYYSWLRLICGSLSLEISS
jgi:hypothetical protein